MIAMNKKYDKKIQKYDKKIQKYHNKAKEVFPYLAMFSYYELKAIYYEMLKEIDSNDSN